MGESVADPGRKKLMSQNSSQGNAPHRGWYLVLIAGALLCSGTIAFFTDDNVLEIQRLREQREQTRAQHQQLKEKNQKLKRRKTRLRQDPHLIEELARDKLGYHRPGEKRVRIENDHRVETGRP